MLDFMHWASLFSAHDVSLLGNPAVMRKEDQLGFKGKISQNAGQFNDIFGLLSGNRVCGQAWVIGKAEKRLLISRGF